jgi:hypothetical protein
MTAGPLHHVVFYTLMAFGSAPVQAAADSLDAAHLLLPVLQAVDVKDNDALDGLYGAVEELLPSPDSTPDESTEEAAATLRLLTTIAAEAGQARTDEVARELFRFPVEMACVIVHDADEDAVTRALQVRILAAAAAIDTAVAGELAGELRALKSNDPRDEPALRADALRWWGDTVQVAQRLQVDEHFDLTAVECPEPGAALLKTVTKTDREAESPLASMSTATAVVAVVQAVSALSITLKNPDLAYELLSSWD